MDYRLIVLSSSGAATDIEEWVCASDVEAAERASRHVSSFGCELWRGDQRIGAYPGAVRTPAAPVGADL